MTDLEAVRKCAGAMNLPMLGLVRGQVVYGSDAGSACTVYDPLTNKAQAFELVERFRLEVMNTPNGWRVWTREKPHYSEAGADLPRAIVYCVARMREGM